MPPILPTPSKSMLRRYIACTGDSLTNNGTLGNFESEFWPALLEKYLDIKAPESIADGLAPRAGGGCSVRCRNFGHSGNTSGPYVQGSATCNTVGSQTNLTLTGVAGTFKVGQTVIVNGQMNQILTYNAGTGVTTFNYAFSGLAGGNNYPVYGISDFGGDIITRLNMLMGSASPRALELLFQYGKPEWDPPDVAAIWIGVNDPNAGVAPHISGLNLSTTIKSAPTQSAPPWPQYVAGTTLIPVQTGQGASVVVGQLLVMVDWTQSPARCWVGIVTQVTGDTAYVSANTHAINLGWSAWFNYFQGGANPLPSMPPVGASVYQGTEANVVGACLLLQQYAGVSKFLIANTQYQNYSAGQGDTLATPASIYATLRPFQAAAVALLQANGVNAALVDIYSYMRTRIVNGDWSPTGRRRIRPSRVTTPGTSPTQTSISTHWATPSWPWRS